MNRNRSIAIRFEKEHLHNLVQDGSSCVQLQECNYHIALHPFHLNNVNESIKDILNGGIAKYNSTFGGILLGYQNIKLLDSTGAIANDACFIHLDISAEFFLFKPEVGKVLSGTVNKQSEDHVGCLLFKTFNVSLPKPEDDDDWLGFSSNIGQEILFRITFIDLEGKLPYIRAAFVSLISDQDSGISTSEETKQVPVGKSKKIIFASDHEEEPDQDSTKKKKKRKKRELSNEDVDLEASVADLAHKKHRRKREASFREETFNNTEANEQEDLFNNPSLLENDSELSSRKKKKKHKERTLNEEEINEGSSYLQDRHSISNPQQDELDTSNSKKKHKRKRKDQDSLEQLQNSVLEEVLQNSSISEIKHKKRKKHSTVENSQTDIVEHLNTSKLSKKLKKPKAEISLSDLYLPELFNEANHQPLQIKKERKDKYNRRIKTEVLSPRGSQDNNSLEEMQYSVLNETNIKKEKLSPRKNKHKNSLEELQNSVLNDVLLSFNGGDTDNKSKKHKESNKSKGKSKKRTEQNESEIYIPDLNISNLFNENTSSNWQSGSNFTMADNEDRGFKKRSSLTSSVTVPYNSASLDLLHNSDLESLLGNSDRNPKDKTTKKRKRTTSNSSDDFQVPKKKKKSNFKHS